MWTSLIVFAACYVLFVVFPTRRSVIACGGALLLILSGTLTPANALLEKVSWNVMGLFFGTLVLAEFFLLSRMPAVIAEWLVDRSPSARIAMVVLCVLSGALSMFVENVAVVLLVAPVALSLAEKLKTTPVPLLIGIAVSSNLQGTATMIGDPPSMILAGYMKMSFLDFFIFEGRPGIFFAVEMGAIASLLALAWIFRKHREPSADIPNETCLSRFPSALLVLLVVGLSFASLPDPDFKWFAGTFTMFLAVIGIVWFILFARWRPLAEIVKSFDWDTTFFLIGVFIVVGALSDSGWIDKLAEFMATSMAGNVLLAFVVLVTLSVVVSGFVDNVPFLLAMIPVAQKMADAMHVPVPLMMFGLLIGACLGGNLTPIGASANIVAVGILRKRGYVVSFRQFMAVGIPFTAVAVVAACLFVWIVWSR